MALLDEGIRTLLLAQGSITAALATTTSVFLDDAPQDAAMPHVIVTLLNEDPMVTLDGTTGMRAANVDIDIVAKTRTSANTVADLVDTYFRDVTGTAGSQTIKSVVMQDRGNDFEPKGQGSELNKYVTTLDCLVHYT